MTTPKEKIDKCIILCHRIGDVDKDNDVPYEDSVKYSRMFKNAKLVTIKGAEHGFHTGDESTNFAIKSVADFF